MFIVRIRTVDKYTNIIVSFLFVDEALLTMTINFDLYFLSMQFASLML